MGSRTTGCSAVTAVLLVALAVNGCGEAGAPIEGQPSGNRTTGTAGDDALAALSVNKVSDLPECTDSLGGKVAYVRDEKAIYACVDSIWQKVELSTGPQGPKGDTGPQGPKGDTGDSGAVSRIKITSEPSGPNCVNGGIRVDAGVDVNSNGALDPAEVQTTGYVCNAGPFCGNGTLDGLEQCDDTNAANCDGCEGCQLRRWAKLPASSFMTVPSLAPALQSGSVCVELWAKVDGSVPDSVLASSYTTGGSGAFLLRCQHFGAINRLALGLENGTGLVEATATTNCNDNAWHHFAGCRDVQGANVTLTIFMDGALLATATGLASKIGTAAAFYVGGVSYLQNGIGGYVDEVRISSIVRYTAPFTPARRFAVDANTLALYHLDEASGATAIDAVNAANNGTLSGAFVRENDTGYEVSMCQ